MKTNNNNKDVFPSEGIWMLLLVIGFLGASTIAHESFVIVYQGRVVGQHAVVIGYLLAGMASIGLFKCRRDGMQKPMEKLSKLSRQFWLFYASCMALPFIPDRLDLPELAKGILWILPLIAIFIFGHNFYSKLKVVYSGKDPSH